MFLAACCHEPLVPPASNLIPFLIFSANSLLTLTPSKGIEPSKI